MSRVALSNSVKTVSTDSKPARSTAPTRTLICVAAVALGCTPLFVLHLQGLWQRPQYQFFPLLLMAIVFLSYRRWTEAPAGLPRSRIARTMLAAALLFSAAATLIHSPWLGMVAATLAAGSLLPMAGPQRARQLLPVWSLLVFLIPLPLPWDQAIRVELQIIVASASSLILDLLGFLHVMEGTIIEFPGHRLLVEEACSGIQSLTTLIAFAAVFAVWQKRTRWHIFLLVLSAGIWAVALNVARVTIVAVAHSRFDIDLATGWQHDTLGLALFALALKCLHSTDQLLLFLLSPVEDCTNKLAARWNRLTEPLGQENSSESKSNDANNKTPRIMAAACVFLLLGCLQVANVIYANQPVIKNATLNPNSVTKTTLTPTWNRWKLHDYTTEQRDIQNINGEYSKTWTYRTGNQYMTASFDYLFHDWHDLRVCYSNVGWTTTTTPSENMVEVRFRKSTGEFGYLFYSMFDEFGKHARPGDNSLATILTERLQRSSPIMNRFRSEFPQSGSKSLYQFQLFLGADSALTRDEIEEARQAFVALRQELTRSFFLASPRRPPEKTGGNDE
ncbi:MAG: hypothetical protein CMJ78_15815 [Planctomycetaceae bacterium]|nr:hypothetical protein [Planctomycetaceae bacterium]